MFGRRKREEAAAVEAAREAERRALFAKLAERPEHVCPFLGLEGDRTGYVEGVNDDHRCYAFGDPATLSAEQQTRVCQERGYGNCPRYLRGVLVIPTEELEALRRPRAPTDEPEPIAPPAPPERRRRRGAPILLALLLLLLVGGGAAAWLLLVDPRDPVAEGTPSPEPSPTPTPPSPSASPDAAESASSIPTPTLEPTPSAGDEFAFYEVSVGPERYALYTLDEAGEVTDTLETSFPGFSFARVEPFETGGRVCWLTEEGGLTGWSYCYPESGEFRIRAVFLSSTEERRSVYLDAEELDDLPEATPAP